MWGGTLASVRVRSPWGARGSCDGDGERQGGHMRSPSKSWALMCAAGVGAAGAWWGVAATGAGRVLGEATAQTSTAATNSSPIAITSDDKFVWSVNPDNNTVSVFNVASDANVKLAEVPVGVEPWCVALTPDNKKAY